MLETLSPTIQAKLRGNVSAFRALLRGLDINPDPNATFDECKELARAMSVTQTKQPETYKQILSLRRKGEIEAIDWVKLEIDLDTLYWAYPYTYLDAVKGVIDICDAYCL
jgi:hypothetical protein